MKASNWDLLLPHITYSYNTSIHRSLGDIPHHILFGTDPVNPKSIFHGALTDSEAPNLTPAEYGRMLTTRLAHIREQANKKMKSALDYSIRTSNLSKRVSPLEIGMLVALEVPQKAKDPASRKLYRPRSGPFRIKAITGKNVTISPLYSDKARDEQTVYIDRLSIIVYNTRQLLDSFEAEIPKDLEHLKLGKTRSIPNQEAFRQTSDAKSGRVSNRNNSPDPAATGNENERVTRATTRGRKIVGEPNPAPVELQPSQVKRGRGRPWKN